ncbi:type II toxin-antitoxin system Phd/YefM family antitoxin [Scytonema sp. NUACC26]|uniref:type II toxin-antitoxin system Phd/YefM family antitoxin n=1 Tax=Scytonema sp. NUACC26 TaxID=3140176 RepID=UPI0034DCBCDC
MPWKLEEAKQKFSELIDAVVEEPQLIYDRNQLVAAVVKADVFQEFLLWQQQRQKPSLADAFTELRGICAEENYHLEVPPRHDRSNPFVESSHDQYL